MEVTGYQGFGGASNSPLGGSLPTMGKEDFLKLLVAQLAHQDPLQPMENSEFVAQLSQFSSVEQLMNANENLSTLQLMSASQSNTQVASLIGKEIEARGDTLRHTAAGPRAIGFELGGAAKTVNVTIRDESGKIVRNMELNALPAGMNTIAWDGKDLAGGMAPPGTYKLEVTAKDAQGAAVATSLLFKGTVTGVSFKGGVPLLEIGSTTIQIADVVAVRQGGASP